MRRWLLHAMLRVGARWSSFDASRIEEFRRKNAAFDRKFGRLDPALKRIAFDADGVPCEWINAPESRVDRVLFYIHGGAFVLRFPNLHAALAGRWCRRLGSRALMVDYRLAPEHPYPAALDDCVAAYRWLLARASTPREIVVGGDSAGGNLALAILHRLKAAGDPLPRCAVLLSPVVDFTLSSRACCERARAIRCSPCRSSPRYGDVCRARALPRSGTCRRCSATSRAFRRCCFRPARSKCCATSRCVRPRAPYAAGVTVELEIWRDMAHVFQALPLPQARPADDSIVQFVERHAGWRLDSISSATVAAAELHGVQG